MSSDPDLAGRLDEFARGYRRWAEDRLRALGATHNHMRLLLALDDDRPRRMKDLAAALGVTARYVTGLVETLEADGLLTRHGDPQDRRATLVVRTPAGRRRVARLRRDHLLATTALLPPMTAAERAQFASWLDAVVAAMHSDELLRHPTAAPTPPRG